MWSDLSTLALKGELNFESTLRDRGGRLLCGPSTRMSKYFTTFVTNKMILSGNLEMRGVLHIDSTARFGTTMSCALVMDVLQVVVQG